MLDEDRTGAETQTAKGYGLTSDLPAPCELRAGRFSFASSDYVVLSYALPEPRLPPSFTAAERAVACSLLRGMTNREIARERGSSTRTIANQVAAIFRKLGVASRIELAERLTQSAPR